MIAVPPKKPCETEGHPERKPFCGHCRWPGETIHESNVYVARAVGKVPQKRKAKGEPGVGLIGINQRPIIAVDSFHLKKMVACTAQHLTLFFHVFSLQVISMHLHVYILHHVYFLNLLDMRSDQPFCQDAGSMC